MKLYLTYVKQDFIIFLDDVRSGVYLVPYYIPDDIMRKLSEKDREVLFEALILARDLNGVVTEVNFSNAQLTELIRKLFPNNIG